jgi:DNA repair photolyase
MTFLIEGAQNMSTYDRFLQMEKHEHQEGGYDVINGHKLPYKYMDIGMVRNAKAENKKLMKVYTKPAPHVILDQNVPLRGWYKNKYEPPKVRARPCFTEALLTQPYGGSCPVRCQFCYVNNGIRGYRGQGVTTVDPAYPDKVAKQLDKMKFGWNAYISSFTEPFQKLESIYHNTERLSEEVTRRGLPLFYLTRQIPPDWAVNYLTKSKYSYMQFSIITSDRKIYKKLSPGAAALDDILTFIKEELKPRGIYVSIQVNPILAGIVSQQDIVQLVGELATAGVDHVIFKFVEIVSPAAPAMVEKMIKLFGPEQGGLFENYFSETTGGLRTIKQSHRISWLTTLKEVTQNLGLTMGLCYEYDHKTNQSMGKQFCTAAQCHGMAIPIHRKNSKGIFEPWTVCPPSGCLYCKESTVGEVPCGSKFLQRATALAPSDYNEEKGMHQL